MFTYKYKLKKKFRFQNFRLHFKVKINIKKLSTINKFYNLKHYK